MGVVVGTWKQQTAGKSADYTDYAEVGSKQ
jgi:hypothetical protein